MHCLAPLRRPRAPRANTARRLAPPPLQRAWAALALFVLAAPLRTTSAQTVVEVQGGGSSLAGGYGATANLWRNGMDGWVGIGWMDGLRVGAFMRTAVGRDTLRLGNDVLALRYPTDVFGSGFNVLVQGATWQRSSKLGTFATFGGASSTGLSAPSFSAWQAKAPLGAVLFERRLKPTLRAGATAVVAERATVVPSLQWQATPDVTAAVAGGVGGGRPYAATSLLVQTGRLEVRAAYVYNPRRFRRAFTPAPMQTELDAENIQVTYEVRPGLTIGAGRQNFVQDSADAVTPLYASGNSLFLGGRTGDTRVSAGLYASRADTLHNVSSFIAVGRQLTAWLDGEIYVLQSRPEGRASSTTPVVNLRERVSPRLGLMQQLTVSNGSVHMLFGGSLRTALGEFGVDYQMVHQPFQPLNPFRSALNLTARLQLGRYSTNFGTYVQPDGRVDYAATGGTFLYMGQFGAAPPQQIGGGRISDYVVRGRVLDDAGQPVEGAAIELGGETVYTNSRGEFLLRTRRPQRYQPAVLLQDFLLPGRWQVRSVPAAVTAQPESRAQAIEIILERAAAAPAPAPAAPAALPETPLP